jgi:hypothetical protein
MITLLLHSELAVNCRRSFVMRQTVDWEVIVSLRSYTSYIHIPVFIFQLMFVAYNCMAIVTLFYSGAVQFTLLKPTVHVDYLRECDYLSQLFIDVFVCRQSDSC